MVDTIQDNKPTSFSLALFGPFEVRVQGMPLPRLHSRKVTWLLALLALRQGKPVERDWLVGTLWPDSIESQALAYLRQSLTELRGALSTEAARLQSPTRHTLALDLSGATVDLLTFDTAVQQGDLLSLARAVEVYRGPLLEGCTEEWVLQERAGREQSCLTALQRLAQEALTREEAGSAAGYLRRVVAVDPLQEGAQRLLMQALVLEGHYAAATQVYRDLRLHLHRELNAEPDPQTTEVYNQIRAQTRQKAQAAPKAAPNLSPSSPPRQLPQPLTDLVGRDTEVPQIAVRLRQRRLLTLTGPGGVGKTRLAIAVAHEVAAEYPDGVFFVELAGVSDTKLLIHSVVATLGVREEPGRSLQETLTGFLRPRLLLLLLDNCEHLLGACAQLAEDLLAGGTGVRIVATSRQALGITGEVEWQVPSLPVPDLAHLPSEAAGLLAEVSEYASVQLFVERAEAVQKTFALTTRNAFAVAQICHRLDGIPLALELAASNVKVLPVEQIAGRLDDVFRLLTRGSRTALPRQQTLRALMDWSYDLLNDREKALLCRLAAFAGGWTLPAAERVCSGEAIHQSDGESIEEWEVLDLLTSLVDKSLIVVEQAEEPIRYHLLETVRQYARDRLVESGEANRVCCQHQAFYLDFSVAAEPQLTGPRQAAWLHQLERDHDNLRQALHEGNQEAGLRIAGALWPFWFVRGYFSEGRTRLESVLAGGGTQERTPARAKALHGAGMLAWSQGDYMAARRLQEVSQALCQELGDKRGIANSLRSMGMIAYVQGDYMAARTLYTESLALFRDQEDKRGIAASLGNLGSTAYVQGDYTAAQTLHEESLALQRELGNTRGIAASLNNLGLVTYEQGHYAATRALYAESLPLYQELGDKVGIAYSLENLGTVLFEQGDYTSARELVEESLTLRRELGDKRGIAASLNVLGLVAYEIGSYALARTLFQESLRLYWELGNKQGIAFSLEAFAVLALVQEQTRRAARLWGAAEALREMLQVPLPASERSQYDRLVYQCCAALSRDNFAIIWSEGRVLAIEQAIEYALEEPIA
jgi:predicted ATPase/DNA-binding SARP family transcriptional activator